jgi:hypothetical protein
MVVGCGFANVVYNVPRNFGAVWPYECDKPVGFLTVNYVLGGPFESLAVLAFTGHVPVGHKGHRAKTCDGRLTAVQCRKRSIRPLFGREPSEGAIDRRVDALPFFWCKDVGGSVVC